MKQPHLRSNAQATFTCALKWGETAHWFWFNSPSCLAANVYPRLGVTLLFGDEPHRAGTLMQDASRMRAKDQMVDHVLVVGSHDDERSVNASCMSNDLLDDSAHPYLEFDAAQIPCR